MAKKKRTAAQFFDDAETNGLESLDRVDVNSNKVPKNHGFDTEINYDRLESLY